jgi:hypothetical protein
MNWDYSQSKKQSFLDKTFRLEGIFFIPDARVFWVNHQSFRKYILENDIDNITSGSATVSRSYWIRIKKQNLT